MNNETLATPTPILTRREMDLLFHTMLRMVPGRRHGVFTGGCWHWVVADVCKPTWILECIHPYRTGVVLRFPMHKRTTKAVVAAAEKLVADIAEMFGVTEADVIRTAKDRR